MKHPKLVGADLYVVRLAQRKTSFPSSQQNSPRIQDVPDTASSFSASLDRQLSGSLYDELTCLQPSALSPLAKRKHKEELKEERFCSAAESRPCYRCVSYMHSVGIKRVFWTNGDGKWECAKVRELADAIDNGPQPRDCVSANDVVGKMFVTKHEVLMMRRGFGKDK